MPLVGLQNAGVKSWVLQSGCLQNLQGSHCETRERISVLLKTHWTSAHPLPSGAGGRCNAGPTSGVPEVLAIAAMRQNYIGVASQARHLLHLCCLVDGLLLPASSLEPLELNHLLKPKLLVATLLIKQCRQSPLDLLHRQTRCCVQ